MKGAEMPFRQLPPVLIAEDDATSRLVLCRYLERAGYPVVAVEDGSAAWTELQAPGAPRLAILDWMLPGMDGAEVCRRLRSSQPTRYTYVMLLTGRGRLADKLEGFEAGADDYLVKPFDRDELLARLAVGRRFLELHDGLATAHERLKMEATRDALTGLLNRGAADAALRRELARVRRQGSPLALALLDLDRFKSINDGYGHAAGDAVLAAVAAQLQAAVREGDLVARWGGEEMVVVLIDSDAAGAVAVAERARAAIAARPVETPAGAIRVTASFGVATTADALDAAELLRIADERCYQAKLLGRNRVVGPERAAAREVSMELLAAAGLS